MNYWIVVVDDNPLSLTHAKNILKEKDMRVSCLHSGRGFLKFMERNSPDLVLLDIQLREMDGFEIYHALRQMEKKTGRRPIPVIFLSGVGVNDAEKRSFEEGASDFIRKPFNKNIFIRRILNAVKNFKAIERLTAEATIDKLTEFLNKASGTSKVAKLCEDQTGMLMIFDLDNFKLVNDLYGHDMGDKVLKTFADIVRRNIRAKDVIARIGGDEFMAFFSNISDEKALASLTRRLNDQLLREVAKLVGESLDIPLGISVGAALVPEHGRDYEMLFSMADSALYKAKQNGKHCSEIYYQATDAGLSHEEDIKREFCRVMQIAEERNGRRGALFLNMEQFSYIYRFIKRFYMRYGGMIIKLMFILSLGDKGDIDMENEHILKEAVGTFSLCLQDTLRKSDIIVQNRPNQFFLLLQELSEKEFPNVLRRIMTAWEATEAHDGIHVEYIMEPVIYEKQVCDKEA